MSDRIELSVFPGPSGFNFSWEYPNGVETCGGNFAGTEQETREFAAKALFECRVESVQFLTATVVAGSADQRTMAHCRARAGL